MKKLLAGAAIALAVATGAASVANAKPAPPSPPTLGATACTLGDISPAATKCVGWYEGNLNGGSPTQEFQSLYALNALEGAGTYTTLSFLEDKVVGGSTVDFTTPLYGTTIVSFHVGAAKGEPGNVGYEGTAFFEFDAGNIVGGLDTITFNRPGLSNARLFSTGTFIHGGGGGVPEPATWAMMLVGFGGLGGLLRSRRRAALA